MDAHAHKAVITMVVLADQLPCYINATAGLSGARGRRLSCYGQLLQIIDYLIVPDKALHLGDLKNGDVLKTLDADETLEVVSLSMT